MLGQLQKNGSIPQKIVQVLHLVVDFYLHFLYDMGNEFFQDAPRGDTGRCFVWKAKAHRPYAILFALQKILQREGVLSQYRRTRKRNQVSPEYSEE